LRVSYWNQPPMHCQCSNGFMQERRSFLAGRKHWKCRCILTT